MTSRSRILLISAVLSTAVSALAAVAGGWVRPDAYRAFSSRERDGSPVLVPGSAAMKVAIDPETGELQAGVVPADLVLDPGTLEALRRDTEGLIPVLHPDGSVSVHLMGRFQSASVARIDGSGRLVICSGDAGHVSTAAPTAAPVKAEVK